MKLRAGSGGLRSKVNGYSPSIVIDDDWMPDFPRDFFAAYFCLIESNAAFSEQIAPIRARSCMVGCQLNHRVRC
jgi:hypothetical protein